MTDKYLKRVLTVIALALWILVLTSVSRELSQTDAQSKVQRRCVWTYVSDEGAPNIGKDGKVDLERAQNWKKLSEDGWELKAFDNNKYIFEKCEP
jgi:hypothetical protein